MKKEDRPTAYGVFKPVGHVRAHDDDEARRIADIARQHRAERAQHDGRFVIEELIGHPGDLPQVAESPDRGLDAQTPSGEEPERAARRGADEASPC